ncbi:AraC family transcriptional regulator [Actinomadura barringtoniae]|uniref:AraC family transcriptional regulator n=1 Tax=Actinomadura barringtoniae TaxID=1427535 RepID=UPI0027DC7F6A|nr:AraC family transcriptional regulator [Actinomadura barringtoniae]
MDDLLRGIRANGARVCRVDPGPPGSWGGAAPLTVYAVLDGTARLTPDGEAPITLKAGEVAVVRHPHTMAHEAPAVLFAGAYRISADVGRRLLDSLPRHLVVPAAPPALLAGEDLDDALVRDRLLDLLLVRALRTWDQPARDAARDDPVVGPVLEAVHAEPSRPWTSASLAAEASVSRATLYRRFKAVVGEAPLSYLAGRRMALAAELLRDPGATVDSVARKVGYTNAFAFSTAFRRAHGRPPSAWRAEAGLRAT